MKKTWLTIDELALELQVSVKSIRRAYRKGEIPVDRFCRFVRFDLERVKEALQANGRWPSVAEAERKRGSRSATGGATMNNAASSRPSASSLPARQAATQEPKENPMIVSGCPGCRSISQRAAAAASSISPRP